jgi:Na+-driven multidrug efflux pump
MVVVNLSQNAVQVSSNMMVGHLPGVLPLSSAAIATSLTNVSGFSLLVRTLPFPFHCFSFSFPHFGLFFRMPFSVCCSRRGLRTLSWLEKAI